MTIVHPYTKDAITRFADDAAFLSNFWPAEVTLDGVVYPSVEHAYQAAKTLIKSEREPILRARKPGTAKALGSHVTKQKNWDSFKIGVMKGLVRQKFTHNTKLALALLATGDATLIEGNHWGDTFWGCVRGADVSIWHGSNHLGKILMEIREELRHVQST